MWEWMTSNSAGSLPGSSESQSRAMRCRPPDRRCAKGPRAPREPPRRAAANRLMRRRSPGVRAHGARWQAPRRCVPCLRTPAAAAERNGGATRAIRSGECVVTRTPPRSSSGGLAAAPAGRLDRRALSALARHDARRLHRGPKPLDLDRAPIRLEARPAARPLVRFSRTKADAGQSVDQAHQEAAQVREERAGLWLVRIARRGLLERLAGTVSRPARRSLLRTDGAASSRSPAPPPRRRRAPTASGCRCSLVACRGSTRASLARPRVRRRTRAETGRRAGPGVAPFSSFGW